MHYLQKLQGSYSRFSFWFASFIFVTGMFLAAIIPSLQSPDEFDHIKRAYLLTKGVIIFETPQGTSSGGRIDTGLLEYFKIYFNIIFKTDRKLTNAEIERGKSIPWSGVRKFSQAPGISYYFPLLYLPQATGLFIGQVAGLSVDLSYRLARMLNLLAISLLIFLAFNIYKPNPLVIAVLLLPMSLFQMSSASIDGISIALTVLSLACFMRVLQDQAQCRPAIFHALAAAVIIISTGRIYLAPAVGLVFLAAYHLRDKKYYYFSGLALAIILAWFLIALNTTVDKRVPVGASTLGAALLYLQHPGILLEAFTNTIFNLDMLKGYGLSFVGVLGWLDTMFFPWQYILFAALLLLMTVLSTSLRDLRGEWRPRLTILLCVLLTLFLMFFSLLLTWNIYPAKIINGVQGRYLLMPAVMLAYALAGSAPAFGGLRRKTAVVLLVIMGLLVLISMPRLLIKRYYLAVPAPQAVSLLEKSHRPAGLGDGLKLGLAPVDAGPVHLLQLRADGLGRPEVVHRRPAARQGVIIDEAKSARREFGV